MRLHRAATGMLQAPVDGELRVALAVRAVHQLHEAMLKIERGELCKVERLRHSTFSSDRDAARDQRRPLGRRRSSRYPQIAAMVPLVSTAIQKPRACKAAINGASSCNGGSPPVQTTSGRARPRGDGVGRSLATTSASASALVNYAAACHRCQRSRYRKTDGWRWRDLVRTRSTGCQQSGRTPPGDPLWRPHPAACRRFP